jgi:hypothetical protein
MKKPRGRSSNSRKWSTRAGRRETVLWERPAALAVGSVADTGGRAEDGEEARTETERRGGEQRFPLKQSSSSGGHGAAPSVSLPLLSLSLSRFC